MDTNVHVQIDNPNTISLGIQGVQLKIGLSNGQLSLQQTRYPVPLELVKDFHPVFENVFLLEKKRDVELFTANIKNMIQTWKEPSEINSLFVDCMHYIVGLLEVPTEHYDAAPSYLRKRYSHPSDDLMNETFPKKHRSIIQGDAEGGSDTDSSEPKFDPNNVVFKVPKNKPKNGAFAKQWKDHYVRLVKFREQFGHANVTRVSKGWEHLGSWVANQRRKLRKGKLTRQQYDLLNDVGIEWDRSAYFKAGNHSSPA